MVELLKLHPSVQITLATTGADCRQVVKTGHCKINAQILPVLIYNVINCIITNANDLLSYQCQLLTD